MGVKGLQIFANTQCPGALVSVNIAQLAANFRRRFDRKPVLVVDGMGCHRVFYSPKIPWVYGGQWKEFLQRVKRFVDVFTSAGVELVFIYDGVVESSKVAEWVKRRNDEMKTVAKIYRSIKADGRQPQTSLCHFPPGLSFYSQQALKMYGATVYCSVIEADRAIFHYYKKHQCFGVLGQDSDFLVYDIHNYFSLNSLSFQRGLKIKLYNKERLCSQLGLRPFHLPLLACLMGNDVIAFPKLRGFHQSITGAASNRTADLLPAVARFLSGLQILRLTTDVVADLEHRVFGRTRHMWGLMDRVVRQYIMLTEPEPQDGFEDGGGCIQKHQSQTPPKTLLQCRSGANEASVDHLSSWDGGGSSQHHPQSELGQAIRRAHVNAEVPARIDNLYAFHLYQRGSAIEDATDLSMPSAGQLFKPLRQKMYGLLLGSRAQEQGDLSQASSPADTVDRNPTRLSAGTSRLVGGLNAVREWVAQPGRTLEVEPEITEAEPLEMEGRPLRPETLWLGPEGQVGPLRFQALLVCMHCDLRPAQLRRVPPHLVLLCLLLRYFEKCAAPRFLRETDVDAALAQAVCLPLHSAASLEKVRVDRVDPRGVHLASLLMRGVSLVCSVNAACALPLKMADLMPWHFFDGELFHIKYLMCQDGASVEQLCDRNVAAVEDFHLVKTCIYAGTPATE